MDKLSELLVCPTCRSNLAWSRSEARCLFCRAHFPRVAGIPLFAFASASGEFKRRQAEFFDSQGLDDFEVTRPRGAPRLYEWLLTEKFHRSVTRVETILRGSTALSVCAGSGLDAELLARSGARVIAADISVGATLGTAERARRFGVAILPVVADVEHLPFADASIDIVYVHDGLHHLERPELGLAEMARVARLAVCVSEPARASVTKLAVRLGLALEREDAGNVVARLTVNDILCELAEQGFRPVSTSRYAMYYRHEPGRAMRLLSRPFLLPLAKATIRLANRFAGRFGNKLVVQAVRAEDAVS